MMRRLAKSMPALSYHFGLDPEQIVTMPRYLLDEYMAALDSLA